MSVFEHFFRVIKATYIVFPSGIVHFVIYLFCMQSMLICRMLRDFFDGLWVCECVRGGKPDGEGSKGERGGVLEGKI